MTKITPDEIEAVLKLDMRVAYEDDPLNTLYKMQEIIRELLAENERVRKKGSEWYHALIHVEAEVEELLAKHQWKPIDSAPFNERVIVKRKGSKTIKIGRVITPANGDFVGDDGREQCATHWQPLPTPPTEEHTA